MAQILGGSIAVWLFYAGFASMFKHKIGLILLVAMGAFVGIFALCVTGDAFMILSYGVAILFILLLPPLQIRSARKEEWRARRAERKNSRHSK